MQIQLAHCGISGNHLVLLLSSLDPIIVYQYAAWDQRSGTQKSLGSVYVDYNEYILKKGRK